jgi:hypothetical protein
MLYTVLKLGVLLGTVALELNDDDNGSNVTSTYPIKFLSFIVLPASTYFFTVGVEGLSFHLITFKHTAESIRLLWMKDRPVAKTST